MNRTDAALLFAFEPLFDETSVMNPLKQDVLILQKLQKTIDYASTFAVTSKKVNKTNMLEIDI